MDQHYNFGAMNNAQETVAKSFLSNPHFAVVGASKDQTKVGNRKEPELEGIKAITDISELSAPSQTALSVITPPKITLAVLKKGKELNVPSYWIQPGAEDEAVLEYIKENHLTDRVIIGGPCLLVLGDGIRSKL
ncbi:hypothetical protein H0H92_010771 [Tricholoma furcatifolium]|nr:hypothetical protein H0H92_010771 [Tricholoma furcatifolium]